MSNVRVDIGINSAFMTRRWEEPHSWVRIIKDLGFDVMSFDSDALDPFFSGNRDYVLQKARQVKAEADAAGLTVSDYFTGYASYRFFGLAHREAEQRRRMVEWMRGACEIAAAIGARGMGGRCDAYSVEVLADASELKARYDGVISVWRDMAACAAALGLEAVYFEQMYVPSLIPYTIRQTYDYIRDCNVALREGCVRPVVDLGHMCGQAYGSTGDDLLYERWLEHFGAACHVIHIQQTRREASDHAPFSSGIRGNIEIETVLEALATSVRRAGEAEWAPYLDVPQRIYLILEALPSTRECEDHLLDQMRESNVYLRRAIPKGGILL